ncbi:unnamed protein product [Somion occarium]|uniref:Survival of motor neuron-related-splicing factor 30 n=1 Tax=Somion occarium TaxID=3059160 RepID=A0ABP1CI90_9APHY
MSKADLETYQVQLSQVDTALEADPSNAELASLRSELKELIALTQTAIAQQEAAASSSKAEASRKAAASSSTAKVWGAGDDCLARYSGDGQCVVFKGYNSTELLNSSQIKAMPAGYQAPVPPSHKRKLSKAEEEEREKKKKKNEKKLEVKAAKAKEQMAKQQTWQKFAKKSEKKGIHIAGVSGTSIFKTPENPLGRVGVTGSGKGMTEVAPRGKHKFELTEDANP